MIKITKGTIIVAVLGYAAYRFFSTGDVTLFPPTKSVVRDAVKATDRRLVMEGDLTAPEACRRISGGVIKQGVFSCKVELGRRIDGYDNLTHVTITKKDGNWVWIK